MLKRALIILIICALGLAACVRSFSTEPAPASTTVVSTVEVTQVVEEAQPAASDEIVNVAWLWQAFAQNEPPGQTVVPNPADYTLLLNPDGTFTAKVDCNQALGSYTLEGSNLTLEPGPSTLAACGPDSLSDQYLALLSQVNQFELIEGQLFLVGESGQMAFINGGQAEAAAPAEPTPAPVPESTTSLVDVLWEWTGLKQTEPETQDAVPNPELYSVVFLEDGSLRVRADCNTAVGEYTSDGNSLTITLGAMTMAACGAGSYSDPFVMMLGQVGSYQLAENQLVLATTDNAYQMSFLNAGEVIMVPPAPLGKPSITVFQPVVVRSTPGADQPSVGVLLGGASAAALGKSPDGAWVAIALPAGLASGGRGWVSAAEVSLYNAIPADLPVIE
jgi:heat shock protein HslJ